MRLTAVYQKVAEGYIAFVEELPGANAQAATLEEARANLAEAVALVLDANRTLAEESLQGEDVIPNRLRSRRSEAAGADAPPRAARVQAAARGSEAQHLRQSPDAEIVDSAAAPGDQ